MSNKKRKEILETISKKGKENVNNTLKGMYGLTPYYTEKLDVPFQNLNEQVLLYKNENRKVNHEHDKDIYFMPEQEKYLKEILNKNDKKICFQAPTSFGKSLLIKEYIYREQPSKVVYIVPTNALAYELEKSYKNIFSSEEYKKRFESSYIIFDSMKKKEKINGNIHQLKEIFIGTPEKFFDLKGYFDEIDLFVIDEAYKLEESVTDTRGYILSKVLLEYALVYSNKLILLTPLAKIQGLEEFDFKFLRTDFNAVDTIINDFKKTNLKVVINNIILSRDKTIYYVNRPEKVNGILKDICPINQMIDSKFLNHLKDEYSEDYSVYKGLRKGILVHHGQMPKYIQNKIINKYIDDENFPFIIGTNSLSEGINTPTKNIIFDTGIDFAHNKMLLRNTIGRAGRLGKYPLGYIYINEEQKKEYYINNEIEVNISVGELESRESVKDETRKKRMKDLLTKNDKNKNVDLDKLLEKIKLPINSIEKFFEEIKTNFEYEYVHKEYGINFIKIILELTNKILPFYDERYEKIPNTYYLYSLLYFSKKYNKETYLLKGHKNKITYLTASIKKDNTEVIDGYFKMRYSSLEYKIMPIITLYLLLLEYEVDFEVGINIHETILEVKKRYAKYIMNRDQFFDLDENMQKILSRLNEYGINISESTISDEMIKEIEQKINIRYSMFDIINVIRELSQIEGNNKNKYLNILENYID